MNYKFADRRPADQKVYYSNITKAARGFGWKPGDFSGAGREDIL